VAVAIASAHTNCLLRDVRVAALLYKDCERSRFGGAPCIRENLSVLVTYCVPSGATEATHPSRFAVLVAHFLHHVLLASRLTIGCRSDSQIERTPGLVPEKDTCHTRK